MRPDTDDYRQLFLKDVPLMDVRAPVEFEKGAFPGSHNIPLLDDEQRHVIGTRYKEQGQDAAIELGWQLATDEVKAQRRQDWLAHIQTNPTGYLYCFRGGLRSRLSQQLIRDAGVDYPLIKGGYKAMRRFLIDELDRNSETLPLMLVSGRTGSGKTLLIHDLMAVTGGTRAVDLEGLAKHRGSAFGRQLEPQPSQIDFENALSIAVMKYRARFSEDDVEKPLFVEDEGKLIGRVSLPLNFKRAMQHAPLAILETPLEERIDIALADYVTDALPAYRQHFGDDEGAAKFREQILGNLDRIRKRLGGERHQRLRGELSEAIDALVDSGNAEGFRPAIELLLTQYYDPMYDYQQNQREGRAIFRGNREELLHWADALTKRP